MGEPPTLRAWRVAGVTLHSWARTSYMAKGTNRGGRPFAPEGCCLTVTKIRPSAVNSRPRASLTVLLVEDEAIVALSTRDALEELGCQVVGWATSAAEAERLAASTPPDVVLMDIRLKGPVDGLAAAVRLRERHQAPIVFVTGLADNETLGRINQVSPAAVLRKPFTREDLRGALVWARGQATFT